MPVNCVVRTSPAATGKARVSVLVVTISPAGEQGIERVGGEQLDQVAQRENRPVQDIRRVAAIGQDAIAKEVNVKSGEPAPQSSRRDAAE